MQWRRMLTVGVLVAGSFLGGLVVGSHQPLVTAQAQGQPANPIQEYTLPNGVLCYTLTAANGSFSCVYAPGLSPASTSAPRP
ncbi:MAG TPA: hypothetical protein VFE37_15130 [Chloroflexota bacterium]|nr:hypothetical protein [Chloroflexota bacterium]